MTTMTILVKAKEPEPDRQVQTGSDSYYTTTLKNEPHHPWSNVYHVVSECLFLSSSLLLRYSTLVILLPLQLVEVTAPSLFCLRMCW